MNKDKTIKRMVELMEPIDRQIMMCDNVDDVLLLASIMTTTARTIFVNQLGGKGAKQIFQMMMDEIDERIVPVRELLLHLNLCASSLLHLIIRSLLIQQLLKADVLLTRIPLELEPNIFQHGPL